MGELIHVETIDGIAWVTFDGGPGNPLTLALLQEMRRVVVRFADAPPDLVVLRGAGEHFSVGLPQERDEPLYNAFEQLIPQRDVFRAQEVIQRLRNAIDRWTGLPCPVVASVQGECTGAGLALALAADFRVASHDASFSVPDVQRGLITGLGTLSRLAVLLGTARTMNAALTRQVWSGEEAERMGLVTRSCPADELAASTEILVSELMDAPSHARQQGLLTLRTLQESLIRSTLEAETEAAARTWIRGEWMEELS